MEEEGQIDITFRRDQRNPVSTVGSLIEELKQLPDDLKIYQGFSGRVRVLVTELFGHGLRLVIEEHEDDDYE